MPHKKRETILILGSQGRMGRALTQIITIEQPDTTIVGVDTSTHQRLTPTLVATAKVVLDFSSPQGTLDLLKAAQGSATPLVIGTTGLGEAHSEHMASLKDTHPIVQAANFSMGITLLFSLAASAARALGPEFAPEILEIHHGQKRDAPSGTALALGEVVAKTRAPTPFFTLSREGFGEARPRDTIGIQALRGGDVVGEHTVFFFGEGERLELTHRATDRRILAKGAWRAARWLQNAAPGLYTMGDVLGL